MERKAADIRLEKTTIRTKKVSDYQGTLAIREYEFLNIGIECKI